MAIMRWDPFEAFLGAQDDLTRLFRRSWLAPAKGDESARISAWAPAVDIYETDDSVTVEAELPGVDPKDIQVSLDDGVLRLTGERKLEREVHEENYLRVERAYGTFERAIRLAGDVDGDKVTANYDNGVLKVKVPKVAPKEPKTIPIKVEPGKANRPARAKKE